MNLYELAFQIFLKKIPSGHINGTTISGIESAANQSIEAAEIFLRAQKEHGKSKAPSAQLELPFPESGL